MDYNRDVGFKKEWWCNCKLGKKNGFTVIELVATFALIGILSGGFISMYSDSEEKARTAKAKAETVAMASAIKAYYSDFGTLLKAGGIKVTYTDLVANKYIGVSAFLDPWGQAYIFANNYLDADSNNKADAGTKVSIYSKGPNKTDNSNAGANGTIDGDDVGIVILNM